MKKSRYIDYTVLMACLSNHKKQHLAVDAAIDDLLNKLAADSLPAAEYGPNDELAINFDPIF